MRAEKSGKIQGHQQAAATAVEAAGTYVLLNRSPSPRRNSLELVLDDLLDDLFVVHEDAAHGHHGRGRRRDASARQLHAGHDLRGADSSTASTSNGSARKTQRETEWETTRSVNIATASSLMELDERGELAEEREQNGKQQGRWGPLLSNSWTRGSKFSTPEKPYGMRRGGRRSSENSMESQWHVISMASRESRAMRTWRG